MHMKTTHLLILTVLTAPACFESEVAEVGVYTAQQGDKGGPDTVLDSSVAIPIPGLGEEAFPIDPDLECHRLVAHAADSSAPYAVPADVDQTVRFTFTAPWQGAQFARAVRPVLDNLSKPVHHWALYAEPNAAAPGVEVAPHSANAKFVYGWIPGSTPLQLPHDFGIPVTDSVSYTLEVHYYNVGGPATPDSSGIELCTSAQPVLFGVTIDQREEI